MLFGEGFLFSSLFATHPPLVKRIQTLEPDVRPAPSWRRCRQQLGAQPAARPGRGRGAGPRPGAAVTPPRSAARARRPDPRAAGRRRRVRRLRSDRAGRGPPARHPRAAARPRAGSRTPCCRWCSACCSPATTRPARTSTRSSPPATAGGLADAAVAEAAELTTLHPVLRLPLAEVAFPALRHRPRPAQEAVLACMHAVIRADGRIDVFEYCLSRLLHRELYESMHRGSPWEQRRVPKEVTDRAVATLLAVLAQAGSARAARRGGGVPGRARTGGAGRSRSPTTRPPRARSRWSGSGRCWTRWPCRTSSSSSAAWSRSSGTMG